MLLGPPAELLLNLHILSRLCLFMPNERVSIHCNVRFRHIGRPRNALPALSVCMIETRGRDGAFRLVRLTWSQALAIEEQEKRTESEPAHKRAEETTDRPTDVRRRQRLSAL